MSYTAGTALISVKKDQKTGQVTVPLTPTEDTHATSKSYVDSSVESIITDQQSGSGALDPTAAYVGLGLVTAADAFTLANGSTTGHKLTVVVEGDTGSGAGTITPASALGFTDVDITSVGDSVSFVWRGNNWAIFATHGSGVTVN